MCGGWWTWRTADSGQTGLAGRPYGVVKEFGDANANLLVFSLGCLGTEPPAPSWETTVSSSAYTANRYIIDRRSSHPIHRFDRPDP